MNVKLHENIFKLKNIVFQHIKGSLSSRASDFSAVRSRMKSQDTIGTSVFDGVTASPVIDQGKNMTVVGDCNNKYF